MTDPTEPEQRPMPETDPTRSAWDDVGSHLTNLGTHVRERFEQTAGASRAGSSAEGDSVRRWIDTLDDAFTSLGDAVRDPAFRREAESSVERLADALGGTLSELGDQLQRRFGRSAPPPGDTAAEPPGDTAAEPPGDTAEPPGDPAAEPRGDTAAGPSSGDPAAGSPSRDTGAGPPTSDEPPRTT